MTTNDRYGPYHQFLKQQACEVAHYGNGRTPCWGTVTGHHRKHVSSGGKDYANELPLCAAHHSMIETEGEEKFQKKTGVNPARAAREWASRWDRYKQRRIW